MTAPLDLQVGSAHSLLAETIAAVAHNGQLFAGVEQLRRIESVRLIVRGSNPAWGDQLDERFSLGCETLALRIGEQLRQQVPS